ncbi:MAG: hydroxyacid dehydrogenase, partial [Gemmataceae bacterium]
MPHRVLIGPAPIREIEPIYGPLLRSHGCELVWPTRNAQMTEKELLAQLPGCVASLAGSEPYTPVALEAGAAAGLLAVCRAGVGYDGVHLEAATAAGIAVGFAPGTNQDAVAEHAVLLMLGLLRKVLDQHRLSVA